MSGTRIRMLRPRPNGSRQPRDPLGRGLNDGSRLNDEPVLITAMAAPRITISNLHADLATSAAHFRADVSAVERSRRRVEAALADGHAHYGINTGFGALANQRVPDDQLAKLQRNLLLSHAVGVGEPVPPAITRVMLRLKIHAL